MRVGCPSGTYTLTIRALVEPALTVEFGAGLVDGSVPVGMQWDDDRMGALSEVPRSRPARAWS